MRVENKRRERRRIEIEEEDRALRLALWVAARPKCACPNCRRQEKQ